MPNTLYDKIWNEHLVHEQEDGTSLLFVDRHLIHEVTSPQAFEGLRLTKRKVRKLLFEFDNLIGSIFFNFILGRWKINLI